MFMLWMLSCEILLDTELARTVHPANAVDEIGDMEYDLQIDSILGLDSI